MICVNMQVEATQEIIGMQVSSYMETVGMTVETGYVNGNPYEGEYVFTPSDEEQIIQTNNKVLLDNITINPIPSNYGKITYNGRTLTVS